MSNSLGIGIVGAGYAGQVHARSFFEISQARITAVSDIREESAKALAEKYNARWYTDYRSLIKDSSVDAVVVAVPPYENKPIIIDAAQAGKHILCEKPMAVTLEDADEMIATANRADVKFMVGYMKRFAPIYVKAKQIIDANEIGSPLWMAIKYIFSSRSGAGWRLRKREGGGAIMDILIHMLDLACWLMHSKVKKVYANTAILAHDSADVEDIATIVLHFEKGEMCSMGGGYLTPPGFPPENMQVVAKNGALTVERMVPYGERGFLGVPFKLEVYKESGLTSVYVDPSIGFYEQAQHFVDCVLNDRQVSTPGEHGRKILSLALAALESAQIGQPKSLTF